MNRSRQNKSPSPSKGTKHGSKHWSLRVHETIVFAGPEGLLNLVVQGGAENGQFCYIGEIRQDKINYHSGRLHHDEIILEIQGEKVAGYTLRDILDWLKHVSKNGQPVLFKTVKSGLLTRDLREYLNTRFEKNSLDHDLQQKIRDNVYKRTVPCTTRTQRPGELDGVDYKFLTVEDFLALEKSGNLLESGLYDGNHYGTPKPSKDPADNPFRRTNSMGTLLPGQHPSSEGKRRRNRSNIEMTATSRSSLARSPSDAPPPSILTRKKSLERAQSTTSLGPLPSNWEMSFTEDGTPYFIDHSSETTHWLDPRLSNNQKIDPLKCAPHELPYGWEKVEDSVYGAYFIDHINRKTQYENPVDQAKRLAQDGEDGKSSDVSANRLNGRQSPPSYESHRPVFTKNPAELRGKFLRTELLKSPRGFGFTIVGGEDSDTEFLQIKNVVPNGPAFDDGKLQRGDVLVHINTQCVLGFTHQDVVSIFQTIPIGGKVALEVCRGYPLPFDPDDPNTEIVTTVAVTLPSERTIHAPPGINSFTLSSARRSNKSLPDLSRPRIDTTNMLSGARNRSFEEIHADDSDATPSKPQIMSINIVKGNMGFGFTIADSAYGQRVKQILDRPRCKNLQESDILVEINRHKVKDMPHSDVVKVLMECPKGSEATVVIQRGGILTPSRARKLTDRGSPVKTSSSEDRPSQEPTYSNVPRTPFYKPDGTNADRPATSTESANHNAPEPQEKDNSAPKVSSTNQSPDVIPDKHVVTSGGEEPSPAVNRSTKPAPSSGDPSTTSDLRSKTPTAEMMSQMGRGNNNYHRYGNPPAEPPRDYTSGNHGYSPPRGVHDDRGYAVEGRFRSRTPGPEFMRQRDYDNTDDAGNVPPRVRRTPEMRSKTPTNDYNNAAPAARQTSVSSTISGTPDFIPASLYQSPPTAHLHPGSYSGSSRSSDSPRNTDNYRYNNYTNSPAPPTAREYPPPRPKDDPPGIPPHVPRKWGDSPSGSLERSRSPARPDGGSQGATRPLELSATLRKQEGGFGFRIIGGTEEGSQVAIGFVVPGGSADVDGTLRPGDEILYVDDQCVVGWSHHRVVQLVGHSSTVGTVTLSVRRRPASETSYRAAPGEGYPYDVTVVRRENEGFGFVIISSVTKAGSVIDEKNNLKFQSCDWVMNVRKPHPWIGKIIEGSPAERCGLLHIGDRILSVNNTDISQMHHEEIVSLIKVSGFSVTLTIGPPQGDDNSSTTSTSHRVGSSPSSLVSALAYPAQSESDLSRRSEYSPYHSSTGGGPPPQPPPKVNNRFPPHQPVLDKQRDLQRQRNITNSQPSPSSSIDEDKYYAVELHRGARGFGFSIRGGREFDNMALYVLRIADGGAADLDARVKVGDQIIEINGYNTTNMTHADAIELISSGGSTVKLLVKRTGKVPPPNTGPPVNTSTAVRNPSSNPSPLPSMPNGPMRGLGQGSAGQGSSRLDTRSPYLYNNTAGGQYGNSTSGGQYGNSTAQYGNSTAGGQYANNGQYGNNQHGRPNLGY